MHSVCITAMRQTVYADLIELYENPLEHPCDMRVGEQWTAVDGERPEGFCLAAWQTLQPFVEALSRGEGDFYDGWMRNPHSAMLSCNDGFRPMTFYLEMID